MRDISTREDLLKIVTLFYNKLFADEEMSVFFEKFKEKQHLDKHLDVLVDFWDGVLFYTGAYKKNAIQPHIEMNKSIPFEDKHFKQWMLLFSEAVDELFSGVNAENAKARAQSIATVMQIKMIEIAQKK